MGSFCVSLREVHWYENVKISQELCPFFYKINVPEEQILIWKNRIHVVRAWMRIDVPLRGGMRFLVRVIGRVEKKSVLWLTFVASLNYAFSLINPRSSFHAVFSLTLQSSCPTPFYLFNFSSSFICQKIQQKENSFDFKAQYHALLYFHVFILVFLLFILRWVWRWIQSPFRVFKIKQIS